MFRNYLVVGFLFLVVGFSSSVKAQQSKSFEGVVLYNIILDSAMQEIVTPDVATLEIIAKGEKYAASIFGNNVQIFENGIDSTILVTFRNLMDGNRYCMQMYEAEPDISPYTYTNETREILGYTAKKVVFYSETDEVLEIWVTDDINISVNQYLHPGLRGLPLEFYLHYYGKYLEVKVQKISREYISDETFNFPLDCIYTTPDELQEFLSEENE